MKTQSYVFGFVIAWTYLLGAGAYGDEYQYVDEHGQTVTIQARHMGAGRGFEALLRQDGQIQIVPTAALQQRTPNEEFAPIDIVGLQSLLEQRFGKEVIRAESQGDYLALLVLAAPLDPKAEGRARAFLKKAVRFMNSVDNVFERYARSMRFPLHEAEFPLVLLIFESEDEFNEFALEATGGVGLSAAGIAGFYSTLTNWLTVRMSTCDTFEVPLHEAIHQQMYNRVLQRLAPVPKWFDEGIATGFEGSGERIDISPAMVNSRYASQSLQLRGHVDWASVVSSDDAFTADVLAGEAYTLAWGMHWMLATRHREDYTKFVEELSQREPLGKIDEDERLAKFEEIFGMPVAELQAEFPKYLELAVKRHRINLTVGPRKGRARQQQALGEFEIEAVSRGDLGGQMVINGTFKNISPLRAMAFYLTVETNAGLYAEWLLPDVAPGTILRLDPQVASKRAPGGPGGRSTTYRVFVRSTPAESETAEEWKQGNVPGPVTGS